MHALQETFASLEGEAAWTDRLQDLIESGKLDEAEAILSAEIETMDSDIARLCLAATRDEVTLAGWDEMVERIEEHEGEPVTGLVLAAGNEADLAFEKGELHAPGMSASLYTDEEWGWSRATREDLLGEAVKEDPAWAGTDEDVEIYLDISGLEALNTALIHAKQRHFIREGEAGPARLRYVEFVVGCWWRALRFHQAVADALKAEPLPGEVAVLAGMFNMRPDVASVHALGPNSGTGAVDEATVPAAAAASEECEDGAGDVEVDSTILTLIQRKPMEEEESAPSGTDLRRRFAANEQETSPGLMARLFRRAS